jgi:hypothetical protein
MKREVLNGRKQDGRPLPIPSSSYSSVFPLLACRPQTPMVRWQSFTKQIPGEKDNEDGMNRSPPKDKRLQRFSRRNVDTHSRRGARVAESA